MKWFFSFLFVCFYLIQNPHFWTNLKKNFAHTPSSSGRDRTVCMVRKRLTLFYHFDPVHRERVQNPGHNMAAGARHFRHSVISVILVSVCVTSRKWRCSGRYSRVLTVSVVHYGQCIKHAVKWTECICVKMETLWDRMQVNKALKLQLLQ
jgi:hypothetical protein